FTRGGWDIYSIRDVPKFLAAPPVLASPSIPAEAPRFAQAGQAEGSDETSDPPPAAIDRPVCAPFLTGQPDAMRQTVRPDTVGTAALRASGADTSRAAAQDTTLALYVRQVYREPLVDSTTFRHAPYRPKFSRDYVSGGAFFASNIGFAGSTVMSFSDVLGNHNILVALNLFGDIGNS